MKQISAQLNSNTTDQFRLGHVREKLLLSWNWIWKIFCVVIRAIFTQSETDKHIEENRNHARKLMLGIR